MNAAPYLLSQLLQVCRDNGSLRTQAQIHHPAFGEHGDLCVLGGFKADSLTTTAKNHDLQHKPYGICWSMAQGSATTKIPTRLGYGPVSKGNATEQPLQAPPTPAPTREPPMLPAVGVIRRPQSLTREDLEALETYMPLMLSLIHI